MNAIEAIELTIKAAQSEIEKTNELIKKAIAASRNSIFIANNGHYNKMISDGAILYYKYNGFEIQISNSENVTITWSFDLLKKQHEEKLKLLESNKETVKVEQKDCTPAFLGGLILGGILF